MIFYSKNFKFLLLLLKNENFNNFIIPLILFKKPYLININFLFSYLKFNKFKNIENKFLLFLKNNNIKFLLKLKFYFNLILFKLNFLLNINN